MDTLAPDNLTPDNLTPDNLASDNLAPDNLAMNTLAPRRQTDNLAPIIWKPNKNGQFRQSGTKKANGQFDTNTLKKDNLSPDNLQQGKFSVYLWKYTYEQVEKTSEITEFYQGDPYELGRRPLQPIKDLWKSIILWGGSGHSNFMNPFEYGKSFLDRLFP